MDLVTIFKPSTLDYSDYGYKKPIKYTESFLMEIAENTGECILNDEHSSKVLGGLYGFTYEDGALKCAVSDGVNVKGKGISPKFEFELIEHEDFFEAVNGGLINAGLTDSPRSHIVCNSIKEEGDNMSHEALEQAMKANAKLERELAVKDNELREMQKQIDSISELQEQMNSLKKENDKYAKNYDDLKNKAQAYDNQVAEQKEKLINKIADGDEEMAKRLENHSLQQLTDVFDVYTKNTTPKGVPTGEGIPEGKPKEEEGEDTYSHEEFASLYEQFFGDEPTYNF